MMNQAIMTYLAGGYRRLFGRRNDQRVADEDTIQCKPIPSGAPSGNLLTARGWQNDD